MNSSYLRAGLSLFRQTHQRPDAGAPCCAAPLGTRGGVRCSHLSQPSSAGLQTLPLVLRLEDTSLGLPGWAARRPALGRTQHPQAEAQTSSWEPELLRQRRKSAPTQRWVCGLNSQSCIDHPEPVPRAPRKCSVATRALPAVLKLTGTKCKG